MKRKQKQKKTTPPVFVFTPESLKITQGAMRELEKSSRRSTGSPAKLAFAQETMQSVNGKLAMMSTSMGFLCTTTFDYNEKIVIVLAIQQYKMAFLSQPVTAQQQHELRVCHHIEQFIMEHLEIGQQSKTDGKGKK